MNKSFIRMCVALIALMVAEALNAQQVSKEIALQKAQSFISNDVSFHQSARRSPHQAPKLVLANNSSELYVFNDEANGGYVVVSGDERMPDVLAYSYNGFYDANNLPCNMKAWMEDYAAQVTYLREHPEAKVAKRATMERKTIGPLLTCWFNQRTPYNNKCPEYDGERCATGCVATAMAQIMHYHQWPKQTTDVIKAYTTPIAGIDMPEIPITTIDWDNILDKYSRENYNEEQANAISTLMLLCGSSICTMYGFGSGSYPQYAAWAFRHIFGYDDLLDGLYRDDYDSDSWEELIYDELNSGRPVLYSGNSEDGGHSFVIDGYNDGYFHVNWGWGGYDSWVLMTSEDKWEGYTQDHSAIFGIQPAYPDNPNRYAVFDNGKFTLYYDNEMSHRFGIVLPHRADWENYKKDVTECVIDPSVANIDLKYRMLYNYFDGWSKLKSIKGIENLNISGKNDMSYMFRGCSSLMSLDLSGLKTDKVTNMEGLFYGCSALTSVDVSGLKTDNVTDMSCMFYGCSALTSVDVSGLKTDNVTDMSCMFYGCSALTSLDVSGFNTANVTKIGGMFSDCSGLTSLNLSGLNTDNVTNMSWMFSGCKNLTNLDLSSFNTEKVTNMQGMFYLCENLTSLDLSRFKTENVTDMEDMFYLCGSLTSLDLGGFKTYNVTNMKGMFFDCRNLTSLGVSGFKTDNVTNMKEMFGQCNSLVNLDVSGFNTEKVTNMQDLFYSCENLTSLDVSGFKTDNVTNMAGIFGGCKKVERLDVSGFNTGKVKDMSEMFVFCSSLTTLDVSGFKTDSVMNMGSMFYACSGLTTLDVSGFNTSNVTNMSCMFESCSSLTTLDLNGFKTDEVTNMYEMFYGCSGLTTLDLSSFNTANVTNMSCMFERCSGLTTLDLSCLKTDKVNNMSWMFRDCSGLATLDISGFKTDSVTNMGGMFAGCEKLERLDLGGLNTDNVTNMRGLFSGCTGLTSVDVSGFKTDNTTDIGGMFNGCSNLKKLDLSGFQTNNVENIDWMFNDCSKLSTIYVSEKWNMSKVKSSTAMFQHCYNIVGGEGTIYDGKHTDGEYARIDGGPSNPGYLTAVNAPSRYVVLNEDKTVLTFYYDGEMETRDGMTITSWQNNDNASTVTTVVFDGSMSNCTSIINTSRWFQNFDKLTTIVDIENLKTDSVTNMSFMFYGCTSLKSLDLSGIRTDNVIDMKCMFCDCSSLTSLDVSGFNTANVTNMSDMFSGCTSLRSLDLSSFNTSNVTDMSCMFPNCTSLQDLDLSSFRTDNVTDMGSMFKGCSDLTRLDITDFNTDNVVNMNIMFGDCSSLTSLDLSSFKTDKVTSMFFMFEGCKKLSTIYVSYDWNMLNVQESTAMFQNCYNIVGGAGTTYDRQRTNGEYARIDGGPENPGYFTYKKSTAIHPVEADGNSGDIYSLSGVRICTKDAEGLKPGIYIVSGKKLIVK